MRYRKAQASIEFLLIVATALIVLATVFVVSQQESVALIQLNAQTQALNSAQDLAATAREVYAQGEGARKQAFLQLPSTYDPGESYVANQSIKIRAHGNDYVASNPFDMYGSLPASPGGHWVWVISEGNRVRIGTSLFSLDRTSVNAVMERNSTHIETVTVTNVHNDTVTFELTSTWPASGVTLAVAPIIFILDPGENRVVALTFFATSTSIGFYTGNLEFEGVSGNESDIINLPITVEVTLPVVAGAPVPLINVTPDFWGGTFDPGDNISNVFTVCTNELAAPTSVTFTPSTGEPGSWAGNITALGPMAASSCQDKTIEMIVPNSTAAGVYQGLIDVVGEGADGAEDSITLYFVISSLEPLACVQNDTGTCNCPVGSDYWGVPTCNCQPATIYVLNGTVFGGPDNGLPYAGTLNGLPGEDIMVGTEGADIIYTDEGNDRVCGLEGSDSIYGENGNDILDGNEGDDTIDGGQGNDIIYGKAGYDTLYGDQGDDEIDGGGDDDVVFGNIGTDLIYGGSGNDELHGEDGADILCGNSGGDLLYGGDNNDDVDGGGGTDTTDGGAGTDDCYRGETVVACESTPPGQHASCGPS